MNIEQRLIKAKVKLLLTEPWFGQLACYLNLKEDKKIPTACINERGDLFYNPDFSNLLSDQELKGLVCHEILHLAYQHPFRLQNRNLILWNIAADLKVNSEISRNNELALPKGTLTPEYGEWECGDVKIENINEKTSEIIYDELSRSIPSFQVTISTGKDGQQKVDIDDSNLSGSMKDLIKNFIQDLTKSSDPKDKIGNEELKELSGTWKERVNSANELCKGNIPSGLKRELDALQNPDLPWFQIIRQRFSRLVRKRTWRLPNKKWLPHFFPGAEKNKTLKAVIAIDTSGSMSKADITQAMSETLGIANAFSSFTLYVVFNDAEVWDILEVKNGNKQKILKLIPKGGGGTDFKPVFNLIKKKFMDKIDCCIFFTDLWGDFPEEAPPYKTYWVSQTTDEEIPFGELIHLKSSRN
jgi:predicted metal-dependent peptidase